jgi:hypothetical protein
MPKHISYSILCFPQFLTFLYTSTCAIAQLNCIVISKSPLTGESFISQLKSEYNNNVLTFTDFENEGLEGHDHVKTAN